MARNKYSKDFPLLAEDMARRGLTDKQIAKNLRISKDTFYKYLLKYPDFSDSIKKGKAPVDAEVENILLNRIRGIEYEETTVEYKPDNKKGKDQKPKPVLIRKTKKWLPPEMTGMFFWLKNRRPDLWNKERTNIHHTDDTITVISKVPRCKEREAQKKEEAKDK